MKGKSDTEIIKERNKIIDYLKNNSNEEIEILNSYCDNEIFKNVTPLWLLGRSLLIMSQADLVVFTKDWEQYRGCRIERECAREYGYLCKYLDDSCYVT